MFTPKTEVIVHEDFVDVFEFFERWVSVVLYMVRKCLSDKKVLNYVQVKLMFWKVLWFFKLLFKFIIIQKKGISIAKTYSCI